MRRPPPDPAQPDLLDWQPPEPVARFDEHDVRAATVEGRIARAVAAALKDAAKRGQTRERIAAAMSAFLGQPVSKSVLDAYASQAREDHVISLPRFVALLHATRDRRLLEVIAGLMGWAVIDRRALPMIELAAVREREDVLRKRANSLRQQIKSEGMP